MDSKEEVFNFLDSNNTITKLGHNKIDLEHLTKNSIKQAQNNPLKKITKIARDTNFDYIADNNFPTVIGTIGKTIQ